MGKISNSVNLGLLFSSSPSPPSPFLEEQQQQQLRIFCTDSDVSFSFFPRFLRLHILTAAAAASFCSTWLAQLSFAFSALVRPTRLCCCGRTRRFCRKKGEFVRAAKKLDRSSGERKKAGRPKIELSSDLTT